MMKKATIVGAGLVGSLLSVFLAKRGYRVDVFESRDDMRKVQMKAGRSINLAISDRGFLALSKVGLEKKVREICIPLTGRMVHDEKGNTNLQPYGKEGQYINSVSRGELNKILMDAAEGYDNVEIHFNRFCSIADEKTGTLVFQNQNGKSFEHQSDLIFAADGAFSKVRYNFIKNDRFNYSQTYLEHAYKELHIPESTDGKWKMEKNALHIWPRKNFMLIALPNLDGSFTVTLFLALKGEVSFEHLADENSVYTFFKKYFPDALDLMPTLADDFFANPTSALSYIKCFPWAHGNTLLIGDAAHGIVPFYGQGMNAGFEDCTVLEKLMDAYEENWTNIFPEFELNRKKDTDAICDLALANFIEMRDLVADPKFLLRKKIEKKIEALYPDKFHSVYSMVSFSPHTPYTSALSEMNRQNKFFNELLSIPEIESKTDSPEILERIDQWIKEDLV